MSGQLSHDFPQKFGSLELDGHDENDGNDGSNKSEDDACGGGRLLMSLVLAHGKDQNPSGFAQDVARTSDIYATLCRHIEAVGVVQGTTSRVALHALCYHSLRKKYPDIPSQFISLATHRASRMLRAETWPIGLVMDLDAAVIHLRRRQDDDRNTEDVAPCFFDVSLRMASHRLRLISFDGQVGLPRIGDQKKFPCEFWAERYRVRQGILIQKDGHLVAHVEVDLLREKGSPDKKKSRDNLSDAMLETGGSL